MSRIDTVESRKNNARKPQPLDSDMEKRIDELNDALQYLKAKFAQMKKTMKKKKNAS